MPHKTVYILGAGASKTAKLPTQAEILMRMFSIQPDEDYALCYPNDFLSVDINQRVEKVRTYYMRFDEYRQELGDFIVSNFSTIDKIEQYRVAITSVKNIIVHDSETIKQREGFLLQAYEVAKKVQVTLEDLFTIFDNIVLGRAHFRSYSLEEMSKIHNQLKWCIAYTLVYIITTISDNTQYNRFARFLLDTRIKSQQKDDILTVITMNWDDLLENSLFNLCEEHNAKTLKKCQRIYVDLCFYNYPFNLLNNSIVSTHIKAKGFKNIKVLKMHGSLGWLECPKCGRVYTDFSTEIAIDEYAEKLCPICIIKDAPKLRNLIVTPTFMKSLDNLNIKNIWHNAYIDISEATHLVFVGYSFPDADFEMRCLLKKAVSNGTDISVVLDESDDPEKIINKFICKGFSPNESQIYVKRMHFPAERYRSFFGDEKVKFCYEGFQGYLDKIGVDQHG